MLEDYEEDRISELESTVRRLEREIEKFDKVLAAICKEFNELC